VQGRYHGGVQQFLGVPYAYAAQRFGLSYPWTLPWAPYAYDATFFRPACVQPVPPPAWETYKGENGYSEACFSLNIYAPPDATPKSKLKVMAWLHGGGNMYGSASSPEYNGSSIALHQGVIVVAIEYRLGPFGQFASQDIAAENYWFPTTGGMNYLLDQMGAFTWIKTHIAAFGGDPDELTIFGESAGGVSVCSHLASPYSKGLFKRAIIESGPCNGPWGPHPTQLGLATSAACMQAVGCSTVACLRSVAHHKITQAAACAGVYISVDSQVLAATPAEIFAQSKGAPSLPVGAPLLLGFTTGDSLLAAPFFAGGRDLLFMNEREYIRNIRGYFPDMADNILKLYPPSKSRAETVRQYLDMNSDLCVKCPLQHLAQVIAGPKGAKTKVYMYSYGYQPRQEPWRGIYKGFAGHASEVSMVFGNPNLPDEPFDESLSAAIQRYWSSFAKSGAPRGRGLPAWAPYDPVAATGPGMNLTVPPAPMVFDEYRRDRCELWTQMSSGIAPIPVDEDRIFAFCHQLGFASPPSMPGSLPPGHLWN